MSKQAFVQRCCSILTVCVCECKIRHGKGGRTFECGEIRYSGLSDLLVLYPDGRIKYRLQGGNGVRRFVRIACYALDPEVSYKQI